MTYKIVQRDNVGNGKVYIIMLFSVGHWLHLYFTQRNIIEFQER